MVGRLFYLALASLCLVLVSCSPRPAEVDADRMGRNLIDAIQRDDWPVIDANLGAAMAQDPQHAPKIAELRKMFPPEPPWSIKLLASAKQTGKSPELSKLSYLYTFAEKRLKIDLTVEHYGWRKVYPPPKGRSDDPEILGPIEALRPPKVKPDQSPYRVVELFKLSGISVAPAP